MCVGEIIIANPVDLESLPEFAMNCNSGVGYINLTIMAIDDGIPQRNQTTLIEISVEVNSQNILFN